MFSVNCCNNSALQSSRRFGWTANVCWHQRVEHWVLLWNKMEIQYTVHPPTYKALLCDDLAYRRGVICLWSWKMIRPTSGGQCSNSIKLTVASAVSNVASQREASRFDLLTQTPSCVEFFPTFPPGCSKLDVQDLDSALSHWWSTSGINYRCN